MDIIGNVVAFVFVGLAIAVLAAIVRFSIVSPAITKGARGRLRRPQPDGIDALVGFAPSPELLAFYERAPFLEKQEFHLVDRTRTPAAAWDIGAFQPLTKRDVRENRTITRVEGIPIATDMDKGMYYVTMSGAVRRGAPSEDVEVAPTVAALLACECHDDWTEDED